MSDPNASQCPLRPDGRCTITGLAPLLCGVHAVEVLAATTGGGDVGLSLSDKAIKPPCVPCQHHDSFFGAVL